MTRERVIAAMEENLAAHVAYVQARMAGMHVVDSPELLLVDSGLASDTFNKILRARLPRRDAPARVRAAVGHFRSRQLPFTWWAGPLSAPEELPALLAEAGLRAAETELGMAVGAAGLPKRIEPPGGLEIRRVEDLEALGHFADINAANWDPPDPAVGEFFRRAAPLVFEAASPMRLYVGYWEGEPAAAAELFLGGGAAGIHMVSTKREFRRRGIGFAMTWRCAKEGVEAGMEAVVLQASADGAPVYARLGFEALCEFTEYAPG
jgi:ribosomal protein S18 acetylase RimI-like enzyme